MYIYIYVHDLTHIHTYIHTYRWTATGGARTSACPCHLRACPLTMASRYERGGEGWGKREREEGRKGGKEGVPGGKDKLFTK